MVVAPAVVEERLQQLEEIVAELESCRLPCTPA